jgi:hypothetical protein
MSPLRGQLVNALLHKQVIGRLIEPNEWFCFSEAATNGIIYPKTHALMRDFEYHIEEASSGTHQYLAVQ